MYELCHVCKYFCLEEMCVIYISVVKVRLSRNECHELTIRLSRNECHESTITYECNTMLMYECHMNTVIVRVTYKQKVRHFCCIFVWKIFLHTYFFVVNIINSLCFVYFFSVAKSLCWNLFVEIFCKTTFLQAHNFLRGI